MGNLDLKKEGTKRGLLLLVFAISILGLNLISSYSGSFEYFGRFSSEDIFLAVIFVVIFFIINLAFSKFFKDSQGRPMKTAWVPALALAFGATYGLSTTGFNLGELFFNIGFSSDILDILAPVLLLGFLIFLIKKWGFSTVLFFVGGGFVLAGITGWIYQSGWAIFGGIALIVLGILIKKYSGNDEYDYDPEIFEKGGKKGKITLQIVVKGDGKTKPKQGIYHYNKNKRIKLIAIPSKKSDFSHWRIDGRRYNREKVKIKMDKGHFAVAVFSKEGAGPRSSGSGKNTNPERGKEILKEKAKKYKKKSKKSGDPKYDGSWARFISYLRRKKIGKNERDVCKKLNISQKDFVKIFNKYGKP